jgi:DNA repair protein SbcC/Rad50
VRPLRLEIQGLRSYVDARVIDFRDRDLLAIIGDTGAGKSSILEAICFALYGSASWNAKAVKHLISHGADTMQVELAFVAAGNEWKVFRSTSKESYPPARSSLLCEALGVKLDKKDEIDRKIVELVGLDYKAFLHCVILPQGRFQELLQATAAERTRLLKGVFQLDVLERVRDWADDVLRERRPQLETLNVRRARLRQDPAADAAAAEQALATARAQHEELRGAQARYREHAEAATTAAAQVATIEKLVASLDASAMADTRANIDEVRQATARIAAEQAALAAKRQGHEATRAALAETLAARARDHLDGPGLVRAGKALDRVSELAARLEKGREEIALQEGQADKARGSRDAARDKHQAAAAKREEAQRASMAAHLAAGLAHGDDCPVCAQPLPKGFKAAKAPDLLKAEKAVTTAETALGKAETALSKAEGALAEARREAHDHDSRLHDTIEDLPAVLRPAIDDSPAAARPAGQPELPLAAAAVGTAIEQARARLQALRSEVEELGKRRDALERENKAMLEQAADLDKQHTNERLRARDLRGEVAGYARAQAALAALLDRAAAKSPARDAEIEELGEVAGALAAEVDAILAAAAGRTAEAGKVRTRAEKQGRAVLEAAACATAEELSERLIRAHVAIEQNGKLYQDAMSEIEPARALDQRIATATAHLGVVEEIRAHMADGKFTAHAVTRKQEALLTVASRLLGDMTANRFGFGADFTVVDRRAGEARPAETLSGGETFLAALSLALALVELAGRAGGRLEALFLDEGFGSLDADALDLAIEALVGQARQGRLVAVISHLRVVAESIENVLYVEATPGGSNARWLDPAERSAMALDDAGLLG